MILVFSPDAYDPPSSRPELDLDDLTRQYAGRGSAAHHPAVLLGPLIYGYANSVHSSRKIERATHDS